MLEHVATVVIHDLQTLDLRIDVKRLGQLADGSVPVELLHTSGGVDDKDDVLAVSWNTGDRIVVGASVERCQASHLVGQALLSNIQGTLIERCF